ncbi:putative transporter [Colletotrichum shisoi]|uniref:Putative transporter n=1 Tax=Colletotrichum shisoi TaxID=2078593 RepID=A0A5Q4C2E0_9PEZI|nr:putative transporter [Colletotrichum shisoi]
MQPARTPRHNRSGDDLQVKEKVYRQHELSPREIQGRFDLLRDLSDTEMEKLNKGVVRKIDWRMMPAITAMFLMRQRHPSYLDRINVSNARLGGMQEDLHMSDTMWNLGISTFYIGYVIGQLPGNLWLAKANPRWFLPSTMLAWGAATICTPALTKVIMSFSTLFGNGSERILLAIRCFSGAGFAALQFFTGLAEAPFFPGITLMTSSWYKKHESPTRMAIWHAGNTVSNITSGFLAAGILTTMGGVAGMYSQQWFFLIEGIATFLIAFAAFALLPDRHHNTRFLTPAEREMAQYRILRSNGGVEEVVGGTWDGFRDAVKDPFTWIFCLMHFALVTAQAFKDFLPSLTTYLIQAPPYAFAYAFACVVAWSSGRRQESFWHIVLPIIGSAVGCAVLISTTNVGARYFGLFLLISGTYNGLNLQLS